MFHYLTTVEELSRYFIRAYKFQEMSVNKGYKIAIA